MQTLDQIMMRRLSLSTIVALMLVLAPEEVPADHPDGVRSRRAPSRRMPRAGR
jgi:hypothetical protein